MLFHAPVTVGSENDPCPWGMEGHRRQPQSGVPLQPEAVLGRRPDAREAKIPAGPNNPVGVVWIDLSKPHYGIHGTPEPSRIGYTESHGCIRLTNWDAMRLAELVGPGTKVVLR